MLLMQSFCKSEKLLVSPSPYLERANNFLRESYDKECFASRAVRMAAIWPQRGRHFLSMPTLDQHIFSPYRLTQTQPTQTTYTQTHTCMHRHAHTDNDIHTYACVHTDTHSVYENSPIVASWH